jgi:hypothetical protein
MPENKVTTNYANKTTNFHEFINNSQKLEEIREISG